VRTFSLSDQETYFSSAGCCSGDTLVLCSAGRGYRSFWLRSVWAFFIRCSQLPGFHLEEDRAVLLLHHSELYTVGAHTNKCLFIAVSKLTAMRERLAHHTHLNWRTHKQMPVLRRKQTDGEDRQTVKLPTAPTTLTSVTPAMIRLGARMLLILAACSAEGKCRGPQPVTSTAAVCPRSSRCVGLHQEGHSTRWARPTCQAVKR
jgi:hypothetical protein